VRESRAAIRSVAEYFEEHPPEGPDLPRWQLKEVGHLPGVALFARIERGDK
jgi:hypothetical protein